MKLSTRARYGMRALLDLGLQNTEKPVQLKDIAERQQLSLPYLEHLIIPLISADIVRSKRGARGGISLARPAGNIKLREILEVLEGKLAPVDCLKDNKSCSRSGSCVTQDIWSDMGKAMEQVLDNITLQELVERQKVKDNKTAPMYYI